MFFYLGIDPRVVLLSTAEAPGHHPLQLTITRQWAAGVALSAAGTAQVEIKLVWLGVDKLILGKVFFLYILEGHWTVRSHPLYQ